jgi:hypothetical protein
MQCYGIQIEFNDMDNPSPGNISDYVTRIWKKHESIHSVPSFSIHQLIFSAVDKYKNRYCQVGGR